jgi:diguanylate cyclase (GGDEF)-like protein
LTQARASTAAQQTGSRAADAGSDFSARRANLEVMALSGLLVVVTGVLYVATPNRGESIEPGGWWAFVVVTVMFGLSEYTVFNVQFRREGISFALSEIPLAFALVFLAPLPALLSRLPLSVPVLVLARKNRGVKLAFNIAIFLFELQFVTFLFRTLLEWWGGDTATMLVLVVLSWFVVAPFTPVLIAVAISRFEGGLRDRIIGGLRGTWWMYTVNVVLGAMTVALALFAPALAVFAILPVAGMWYVLRSYGEVSQELRDLDAVHGFAGRVGGTLDVNEIGDTAVDEVVRLTRGVGAALVRFTGDEAVVHSSGMVDVALPKSPDDTGWESLLVDGQAGVVEASRLRQLGIDADASIHGMIVAPVSDERAIFAVLVVVDRNIQAKFQGNDVARVKNIAEQLAVSLRRGMLHERLEFEARHDALTNLPARTLFERHVNEAVARSDPDEMAWVVMLDLDRFKEVNDTLGHHAGDDLLIQFAARMSSLLEPDDVLARLAGDEFAILCVRDTSDEIVEFAQSCVLEGGRPVMLDELEIVVTVSVGVAEITAQDSDAVQPMRRADIAMYNAKWQRTGVEFYRDEIDRRTPARLSMLGDLRSAIESDQLDVVFQPKLHLGSGNVVGVEALVRWNHPTRGNVPPSEFVRVAEDTGLIKQLTDLVLARGIAMLRSFDEQRLDVGLAVNLSTHDLFDSRLPDRVRGHLEANGVEPASLTLEITESSLFVDAPRTRATIDELHAVGLRMAVDDFGTGYSSLSYLRRLPVHELKIDQSFVGGMLTDQQDEVIVRSTVDLGHNLGLLVVAEGVESWDVLERLREMGCDVAQGYVISEPIPSGELIGWLQRAADRSWLGPAN